MAQTTAEQQDALAQLRADYGEPDDVSIEFTPAPYGLLRVVWRPVEHARAPERRLYVRPDGTRLSWRAFRYHGEDVEDAWEGSPRDVIGDAVREGLDP